jgi:hypothetical protein
MVATLDYAVASSGGVLVGRVSAIGEAAGSHSSRYRAVTLTAQETLWGEPLKEVQIRYPEYPWDDRDSKEQVARDMDLHGQMERGDRILAVLVKGKDGWFPGVFLDLDDGTADTVSREMRRLTTADALLGEVREETAYLRTPEGQRYLGHSSVEAGGGWNAYDNGRFPSFITGCSNPQPELKGSEWSHASLIVPADSRLEAKAHAVLAGGSDALLYNRPSAVYALRSFHTPENVTLLRGVLAGADATMRQEAWMVLSAWKEGGLPAWKDVRDGK